MKKTKTWDLLKRMAQIVAVCYWCVTLLGIGGGGSEAYLLTAAAGLAGYFWFWTKARDKERRKDAVVAGICSLLLSCAVILANYNLFPLDYNGMRGTARKIVSFCGMMLGGYSVFRGILHWIYGRQSRRPAARPAQGKKDALAFWGAWGLIACVYGFFWFFALYPGIYVSDSLNQLRQIYSGNYTNHHPYYHTQLIRLFVLLGKDTNTGLALYSVFSLLLLSFSFAYVVYTAYQYTGSKLLIGLIAVWYASAPFHIFYSVTAWKDTPFTAAVVLFLTSTLRLQKGMGTHGKADRAVWILSGIGVCLLRSNGFLALAAVWILLLVLFGKENRRMAVALAAVLCGCFVLKNPVLNALGVAKADFAESISIPLQQIARIVTDGSELTQEQYELLEQVIDVEKIPETYASWISDPMKDLLRERNNQQYLTAHKWEYLRLYVQLGLKYPASFLYGWVDQTKGYWNGGYDYWRWITVQPDIESLGLSHTARSKGAVRVISWIAATWEKPLLKPFLCIGLYTWMLIFSMYAAFVRRDRKAWFTAVLPTMIIGTLLVATPVFAEFRYAYGVIASMPMVITACFYPGDT